jgi:hypothetical protein
MHNYVHRIEVVTVGSDIQRPTFYEGCPLIEEYLAHGRVVLTKTYYNSTELFSMHILVCIKVGNLPRPGMTENTSQG